MNTRPNFHPDGDGGGSPRRAGSVTLREEGGTRDAGGMHDPANQSLADALRIMLVLLQGAMVVLAGLYVASGFQSVKEDERGIRLLFGKVEASNVPPGFVWSAPFPLGQLIRVNTGSLDEAIDRDFWPDYPAGGDTDPEKLTVTASLKPGTGGSMLTADGNIAHSRWKAAYHVQDAGNYARTILSKDEERKLVRAAVKRGVVHACARVRIDELLTQSGDRAESVRSYARLEAQRYLDQVGSGLVIDQLNTTAAIIPPLYVRADFAKVQSAVSTASKAVEDARAEAGQTLLRSAGQAAPYLIERIESYEAAMARRDAARAVGDMAASQAADREMIAILTMIDGLLRGEPVAYPGGTVDAAGATQTLAAGTVSNLAGGEVAKVLGEAGSYRTGVVNRAQADARTFDAKLAQYRANPALMLQRELAEARTAFLGRDTVQQFQLPLGMSGISLVLNYDPDVARDIQRAQKERERIKAEDERMRMLRDTTYKTETGLTVSGG
ncbi:MAG: hypothetical protein HBSAPP03_26140 [Phycisphaerae bacterium]|nr:MAG: hypothetical protein HBSAPP03_26140 [Phycisphaerae bacterium]